MLNCSYSDRTSSWREIWSESKPVGLIFSPKDVRIKSRILKSICVYHPKCRVARVNPEAVERNSIKSKKLNFDQSVGVLDCASTGQFTITRWDQFVNASAYGPNEKVSSRIPSYHSYTSVSKDYVKFYHHVEQGWTENLIILGVIFQTWKKTCSQFSNGSNYECCG